MSQILLRLGRSQESLALLADFQKLADNPRARTVDFVYTKMGPLAEALAVDLPEPARVARPPGPLFADSAFLLPDGMQRRWNDPPRRPADRQR